MPDTSSTYNDIGNCYRGTLRKFLPFSQELTVHFLPRSKNLLIFSILQDLDVLRSIEWELLIIDEPQRARISSHSAQIKLLATERRLLLVTGQLKVLILLCLLLPDMFHLFQVFDLSNFTGHGRRSLLNTLTC